MSPILASVFVAGIFVPHMFLDAQSAVALVDKRHPGAKTRVPPLPASDLNTVADAKRDMMTDSCSGVLMSGLNVMYVLRRSEPDNVYQISSVVWGPKGVNVNDFLYLREWWHCYYTQHASELDGSLLSDTSPSAHDAWLVSEMQP